MEVTARESKAHPAAAVSRVAANEAAHPAAARAMARARGEPEQFLAFDRRLNRAARLLGLRIADLAPS
jgi:hypothetical protein